MGDAASEQHAERGEAPASAPASELLEELDAERLLLSILEG